MDCSALGREADNRDRHDAVFGKALRERGLGLRVVTIAEGRYQHEAVADQEVQVAGVGEIAAGTEQRIVL